MDKKAEGKFKGYVVHENKKLGKGPYGEVYEASKPGNESDIAVKIINKKKCILLLIN